jgi:hypothetical protein
MKNNLLTGLCILFAFVIVAQPVSAAFIDTGFLSADMAKYEPYPAEAGKYVTVWFDVVNRGNSEVNDVTFSLETKYPFSLPDNDSVKTYSRITGLDDIRLEYRLLVDKNAPNSTSEVKLKYGVGSTGTTEKTFSINVVEGIKEEKADLNALFVDAKPVLYATGASKLTVDIINRDDGVAYHTIVKADSDFATIPRNEVFVGNLDGDDFNSVDFDMNVNDIAAGTYPVDITMIYKDSDGNIIEQKNQVYVNVLTKEEALATSAANTSPWMAVIYIIVIIVLIRALLIPFVRWFVKPFRKKKGHHVN